MWRPRKKIDLTPEALLNNNPKPGLQSKQSPKNSLYNKPNFWFKIKDQILSQKLFTFLSHICHLQLQHAIIKEKLHVDNLFHTTFYCKQRRLLLCADKLWQRRAWAVCVCVLCVSVCVRRGRQEGLCSRRLMPGPSRWKLPEDTRPRDPPGGGLESPWVPFTGITRFHPIVQAASERWRTFRTPKKHVVLRCTPVLGEWTDGGFV